MRLPTVQGGHVTSHRVAAGPDLARRIAQIEKHGPIATPKPKKSKKRGKRNPQWNPFARPKGRVRHIS